MMNYWLDISYMVELICACLLFMSPVKKRKYFPVIAVALSVCMIACIGLYNEFFGKPDTIGGELLYWAAYLLISIFFVWCCMGQSVTQAIYCSVCAFAVQHISYNVMLIYNLAGGESKIISVCCYVAVYLIAYFFCARKLPEHGRFVSDSASVFPIATIIMIVWILGIMDGSDLPGFEAGRWHRLILRVIDCMCCFYVLWVQISQKNLLHLHQELNGINTALYVQNRQYKMTADTIENINRKCHDLKHQIRALKSMDDGREKNEYLKELENDIMIYDTALKTGNRALDIVLMEKALYCKNHEICWTCMADGEHLDFMRVEDIYAIFGNALDNAITAVMKVKEPDKRVISTKMIIQSDLMVIQVQNYYDGELIFDKGLPLTTKKNKADHGYGMKSIRYTAEKYNGTITVQAKNQIFMLQILIPVPAGK